MVLVLCTSALWLVLAGLIWVAVRLDSKGPAIYRQARVGCSGKIFTLYKFRTMVVDAERNGPIVCRSRRLRLTRVGRWCAARGSTRSRSCGTCSRAILVSVGPRPERPVFTEQFDRTIPFYSYRHLVRPGVTGWAQVNYGYADDEAQTVDKLTYDLYYVKHMSPWLDAQILGQSIWTVLSGFGAQ